MPPPIAAPTNIEYPYLPACNAPTQIRNPNQQKDRKHEVCIIIYPNQEGRYQYEEKQLLMQNLWPRCLKI